MHCKALIVDILITDYDADINTRDYSGKKPGHYAQSDMPTWVQRALRTNQSTSDGAKVDALVMATTANLTAMSKQSVSRSWNSFRHENLEEKMAADKKERDNPSKSRTKSILRSFRKVRNKDRTQHQKDSKEHASKARDSESRERQRSDERSKSVPDICLTPASRSKLLQIEHPHFDEMRQSSNEEVIDVEHASKYSGSGRSSSDIDDVFVFHPAKTNTEKPERASIGNTVRKNDGDDVISPVDHKEEVEPAGLWASELLKDFGVEKKLGKDEYANTFADKNANQWKATTVV
ncbi:uncharacterized protein LOC135691018 [Rhopilema esculentum]|uniref:uncharacterized protein LOC135691018 n=1 Tax=Rhopilema esculentum TaxID=499914 RepID=UPI0031DA1A90